MAKKTDTAGDAPAGKKSKNNLVPAVVVAIGLLGAAYFMSSKGGKAPAASAATATAAASATGTGAAGAAGTPAPALDGPAVATGEAITLNMADGRFLKVQIALALAKGGKAEGWTVAEYAKA